MGGGGGGCLHPAMADVIVNLATVHLASVLIPRGAVDPLAGGPAAGHAAPSFLPCTNFEIPAGVYTAGVAAVQAPRRGWGSRMAAETRCGEACGAGEVVGC